MQGNVDLAIKSFLQAAKIDPKHYGAYLNLGVAYRKNNMLDKSIEAY